MGIGNPEPFSINGGDIIPKVPGSNISIGTGIYKAGSYTKIYESSGDSYFENVSSINDIILKLGSSSSATKFQVLNSSANAIIRALSDGAIYLGLNNVYGVLEVLDSSSVSQAKLNSFGAGYHVYPFGHGTKVPIAMHDIAGSETKKVRTITGPTGTITTDDNTIACSYTPTSAVSLNLPSASSAWNSTDNTGMIFTIMDIGCNASVNYITINRNGTDTIIDIETAQTSTTIELDGGVILIQAINSTTWKVF